MNGVGSLSYIDVLEQNSHIIYPGLAVLAVGLVVLGVLSAWRSQEVAGLRKAELKREIILELRRQAVGMSGDAIARAIGLQPLAAMKLLEELQRDNILVSYTNTQRLTLYRLKGAPPVPSKKFY
jgi:hypothetical protein